MDDGWQPIETAPKDEKIAIPLTLGQSAEINACDAYLVMRCSWQARPRRDSKGYYAVNASGTRMHRMIMGVDDDRIVDHIDGDGLNNTRANLRIGTQSQNCVNRKVTPGNLLRGVTKQKNKFRARIKINGKMVSLGYFNTEQQAHEAYARKAVELHGDWMPLPAPPVTTET